MTDNEELHVNFGTGPVGLAVMDELVSKGKCVRMVNRNGRASVPKGAEVVGGDDADPTFTREASAGLPPLNPNAKLKPRTRYRAVVTTGARDLSGNQLDQNPGLAGNHQKAWFFTTRN